MEEIKVLSFAKINLSIDVGEARDSGYHDVDMIMQQLSFHDDVSIKFDSMDDGTCGNIDILVKTNRYYIPTDERNLAYKAAALMIDEYGDKIPSGHIYINILKRVPVAAGLAGGSGNGAAVLHGLNLLWKLDLDISELMELGAKLGSDVPFSIIGQAKANYTFPKKLKSDPMASTCARATGRGTELEPVRGIARPIVIAKPPMGVSTPEVYKGIDSCEISERPDNDKLITDMAMSSRDIYDNFINVLETYTLKAYPEVAALKEIVEKTDADKVLMSGSGPTIFAVYRNMKSAMKACEDIRAQGYEAYWTKTIK